MKKILTFNSNYVQIDFDEECDYEVLFFQNEEHHSIQMAND